MHAMSHGRRAWYRQGSARRAGLLVAGAMALVSASVIGYFVFVAAPARKPGGAPAIDDSTPPSLLELAKNNAGRPSLAQATKGLSAQFASKADPSRLAGRITSASLEPLE